MAFVYVGGSTKRPNWGRHQVKLVFATALGVKFLWLPVRPRSRFGSYPLLEISLSQPFGLPHDPRYVGAATWPIYLRLNIIRYQNGCSLKNLLLLWSWTDIDLRYEQLILLEIGDYEVAKWHWVPKRHQGAWSDCHMMLCDFCGTVVEIYWIRDTSAVSYRMSAWETDFLNK